MAGVEAVLPIVPGPEPGEGTAFDDLVDTDLRLAVARTRGVSGKEACSFCLCLRRRSRRAKQRSHTGH